jgi:hypothetical protein
MAEQQMEQDQQQAEPLKKKAKPREQYGCIPAQTLEEIRAEIRETYPGITDEELEALGC